MPQALPIVLVPGLNCSARLYGPQIPDLWRFGAVTVATHTGDDSMAAIAGRILAEVPPRFALAGLSMGGYIALEIMRQASQRVARLALLDTAATPETPEQTARRRPMIAMAEEGRFGEIPDQMLPVLIHPRRQDDADLRRINRQMAEDVGPQAFVRQQTAIMGRPDSRPHLAAIRCPTLVLVGDADALTPPERSRELAAGIPGARLVVVPDCGHLSTLERPEAVNEALVRWLAAE